MKQVGVVKYADYSGGDHGVGKQIDRPSHKPSRSVARHELVRKSKTPVKFISPTPMFHHINWDAEIKGKNRRHGSQPRTPLNPISLPTGVRDSGSPRFTPRIPEGSVDSTGSTIIVQDRNSFSR